ncbi:MAG: hypothetical protein LBR37_00195 [Erysipelotrichaceae bacterium]|jgi:hypothetical protein|nr:hypothetical protein [Erysipelotrichaceae bacterium]
MHKEEFEAVRTEVYLPNTDKYFVSETDWFLMEELFYSQLQQVFLLFPRRKAEVIARIHHVTKKNHHVIFVYDFENPYLKVEHAVYLEIEDLINPLGIIIDDKSRGSDYGD